MKLPSAELNIDDVNARLGQIKGLGFDAPVTENGQIKTNKMVDPKSMRIEETNEVVNRLTGLIVEDRPARGQRIGKEEFLSGVLNNNFGKLADQKTIGKALKELLEGIE